MRDIDLVVGDLYVHNNRLLEFTHFGSHHGYWFKRIVDGASVLLDSFHIANVTPHSLATVRGSTSVQHVSNKDIAWGDLLINANHHYDAPCPQPKVCECGAHKVGSNAHSSWCALS